jgi:hypothetical protein
MDDILDAANQVAAVDGPLSAREKAIISELRGRLEQRGVLSYEEEQEDPR